MISIRSHVISLVAVFLALAVGVVLGAGPLANVSDSVAGQGSARTASSDTDALAEAEAAAERGDQVALELGPAAYADGLVDRSVVVVLLPGAELGEVVPEQIEAAGGTLDGVVQVEPTLLSPGEKSLVDTLGSQVQTQVADGTVTSGASTYDRLGQLLAAAIATDGATSLPTEEPTEEPSGEPKVDQRPDRKPEKGRDRAELRRDEDRDSSTDPAEDAQTILDNLTTGKLVTVTEAQQRPAELVLVVGAEELDTESDPILADLVNGLAAGSTGTVVAGPGAEPDAPMARLDQAGTDATVVTGVDRPAGAVDTVMALVSAAR